MTPHSMMFPGLHPTAMMSTVGMSSSYRPGPANPSPPAGGGAAGAGGFLPGAGGGQAGGVRVGGPGVSQETTYLYIPNSAVGAIIGKTKLSVDPDRSDHLNCRDEGKPHSKHH